MSAVLVVSDIEPCLPFWTEQLGFSIVVQGLHQGVLGFVVLGRSGIRIQYQTTSMLKKQMPGLPEEALGGCSLMSIRVRNLDFLEHRLGVQDVVVPRRITPQGYHEFGIREPGGHILIFSEIPPPGPAH